MQLWWVWWVQTILIWLQSRLDSHSDCSISDFHLEIMQRISPHTICDFCKEILQRVSLRDIYGLYHKPRFLASINGLFSLTKSLGFWVKNRCFEAKALISPNKTCFPFRCPVLFRFQILAFQLAEIWHLDFLSSFEQFNFYKCVSICSTIIQGRASCTDRNHLVTTILGR